MPASDEHATGAGTLLSWTVAAVHCARCGLSPPVAGYLDKTWLLRRHGQHLDCVSLDLVLIEPDTYWSWPMRLRLWPVELQGFARN